MIVLDADPQFLFPLFDFAMTVAYLNPQTNVDLNIWTRIINYYYYHSDEMEPVLTSRDANGEIENVYKSMNSEAPPFPPDEDR